MNDVLDAIIFYDDLSAEQKGALHAAMDENPDLAESFRKWRKLQREIRKSLALAIPDRNILVLYAISRDDAAFLTEEEQQTVSEALPAIETALEQHPALHDVINDIQSAKTDFALLWDDLNASVRAESPIPGAPAADRGPRRNTRRTFVTRIATAFLVLAITTTAGIFTWRSNNLEIVKTGPGEFRVIELVDGSTIRLFGKSRISYTKHTDRFAANRSIELRGQAFFDIAPDDHPFIVETPTALTHATGTRFSIEANRSLTKVILTAGQVAVESRQKQGNQIMLSPGEMSRIQRRKQPTPPESIDDLTDVLSWTGLLVFHDTPLDEVATHLGNYYDVSISIAPELLSERWVATYDPDTLAVDEILDNLAATLGVSVQNTGENTYQLGFTEN